MVDSGKGKLICIYQKGEIDNSDDKNSPFGRPHKVMVSNFEFDKNNPYGRIRFLLKNPKKFRPLRIKLTAYGIS